MPALFAAALLARLLFLALEPATRPLGDERTWIALGLYSVEAPPASFNPLRSDLLFYPPLHPYLIGATHALFGTLVAVKVVQALLGALLVPVVARLGQRTFGRSTGLVAAAMAAFNPVPIWYSVHFWSEPLFVLLFWWGLERVVAGCDTDRLGATAAGGFAVGLAALTREPPLYFLPLLAAWVAAGRHRRSILQAGVLLVAATAVVAPWTARNWVRFGAFVPVSTMGGRALWEGNTDRPRGEVYAEYDEVGRAEGPVAQHRHAVGEGLRAIRARQPVWLLDKLVHEVPDLFTPDNMVLVHIKRGGYGTPRPWRTWLVAAVTVLPYLAVMALFVLGLARLRGGRSAVLLVVFLVFYTLLHVVVHGHHRFLLPMLPAIYLIAASAVPGTGALLAPLTPRRRAVGVALALLLVLCLVPGFLGFLDAPAFVPKGPTR